MGTTVNLISIPGLGCVELGATIGHVYLMYIPVWYNAYFG